MVYDWRAERRFRLIPAASPLSRAKEAWQSPATAACSSITSQNGGANYVIPMFSPSNGVASTCNIEQALGQAVTIGGSGTNAASLTVIGDEIISEGSASGFNFQDRAGGATPPYSVWYQAVPTGGSTSMARLYRYGFSSNYGDLMSAGPAPNNSGLARVGIGTDSPGVNLEVSGSATGSPTAPNIQARVTNTNTTDSTSSVAYLSTAGGNGGLITILESNAQIGSTGAVTGQGLVGTFSSSPFGAHNQPERGQRAQHMGRKPNHRGRWNRYRSTAGFRRSDSGGEWHGAIR